MGARLEETVKAQADKLIDELGSVVEVKYIDTTKEGLDKYPKIKDITSMGYSFPITSVDGVPRLAGDVVYDDIKAVIEETLAE